MIIYRFTLLEQFVAHVIYCSALLPAKKRGAVSDCARAVGMRLSMFRSALADLDIARSGLVECTMSADSPWDKARPLSAEREERRKASAARVTTSLDGGGS